MTCAIFFNHRRRLFKKLLDTAREGEGEGLRNMAVRYR
jgi:hypothetical protein